MRRDVAVREVEEVEDGRRANSRGRFTLLVDRLAGQGWWIWAMTAVAWLATSGAISIGTKGFSGAPSAVAVIAFCSIVGLTTGYAVHLRQRLGRTGKQAKASEEFFADLTRVAADFLWECDEHLRVSSLSEGFLKTVGRDPQALIGHVWPEVPGLGMAEEARRTLAVALAAQRSFRDIACSLDGADGERHHLRLTARPFFDADGEFRGYRGAGRDVSDLVEAKDRVRYLDRHDALTWLANRLALREDLERVLKAARREADRPVLLAVDIARFGSINDAFGAAVGDGLLRAFAARLVTGLHPEDRVYRQGNDEFAVLRARPSPFESVDGLVDRITQALSQTFVVDDQRIQVTGHVGIYYVEPADADYETCIRRSLIALRQGKKSGEQAVVYGQGMDVEAETQRRLEEELRITIRDDGLALNYQPQVSLKSGRIVGAEALVRWHHAEFGFVSPGRFIPMAERTGLIGDLSRWALRRACEDAAAWGDATISVNLSALDVREPDFLQWVQSTVADAGMSPARVELEITEGVLIEDTDAALGKLRILKQQGFKFALDDFGTGYAGLGYLQMFPFDKLKIDQSFVKRMLWSKHAMAIVRSVIKLGHELDLVVCAEGVEEKKQLEALFAAGCDIVQGYYTGLPMPASRLKALTASREARPGERGETQVATAGTAIGAGRTRGSKDAARQRRAGERHAAALP
ncbi:MAG: EAL domain-containing protein [Geminicoccaceae bacterium]|nr:EAL domain-containing protein [Geminicoccaceae bacterium]